MKEFIVDEGSAGQRADVFLAAQFPLLTRSALGGLFDRGMVKINGKPVKASRRLKTQALVIVNTSLIDKQPKQASLPIIYEDKDVLVINKPTGLLTHSKGALNLEPTVAGFIRPRISRALKGNRAGIVHRLDRGTSGLIITAKTPEAQTYLQKQFATRRTQKVYLAVVEGKPKPAEALIDVPIGRNPKKPQTFVATPAGKTAQTKYKVIKALNRSSNPRSLVELRPETGRTHQLRVHMKYIGHPVVGDPLYGSGNDGLRLHAWQLGLTLPNGQQKNFKATAPDYFLKI